MQHHMLGGGYARMDNEYDQGYGMEPVSAPSKFFDLLSVTRWLRRASRRKCTDDWD